MDLRQLATFRMAASTLSFTQAAAALGYVQSTVTAQIQALEIELGVRLFDRLGRRVALTAAGERLLSHSEQLLNLAQATRTAILNEAPAPGSLTISATETLCTYRLPKILRCFRALHPSARVAIRSVPARDLRRMVYEGTLDVALILEKPVNDTSLTIEPLCREKVAVVAHPDHPLARLPQVRATDLAAEQVLFTELGCSYRNQFEQTLIAAGVYPAALFEFGSVESIKQFVIAGLGVAALPEVAVQAEIGGGRLAPLAWVDETPEIVFQLVWHKGRAVSPALQAFVAAAETAVRSAQ